MPEKQDTTRITVNTCSVCGTLWWAHRRVETEHGESSHCAGATMAEVEYVCADVHEQALELLRRTAPGSNPYASGPLADEVREFLEAHGG